MGGVTNRDRGRRALPAGIPQGMGDATNCHHTRAGGRYELQSCLICRRTPNLSHRDGEAAKEGHQHHGMRIRSDLLEGRRPHGNRETRTFVEQQNRVWTQRVAALGMRNAATI